MSGFGGPTTRRRLLPGHTEQDMLELEARAGIHAGMLSSNAGGDIMDAVTGGVWSPEQSMRGWSAQQPWSHIDCPVLHVCILCGRTIEPDFTRDHALKECKVSRKVKELL